MKYCGLMSVIRKMSFFCAIGGRLGAIGELVTATVGAVLLLAVVSAIKKA